MHYFGEKMHKTKVFLHKSEKYAFISVVSEDNFCFVG